MDYIVTVPDPVVPRIVAALTAAGPDGQAKTADVPGFLKSYLHGVVISYESGQAAQVKQASVAQENW